MIQRTMLAVAYATGMVSHARQVMGDDPDKKGSWPSRLGVGHEANNPTPLKKLLQNCKRRSRPTQRFRAKYDEL